MAALLPQVVLSALGSLDLANLPLSWKIQDSGRNVVICLRWERFSPAPSNRALKGEATKTLKKTTKSPSAQKRDRERIAAFQKKKKKSSDLQETAMRVKPDQDKPVPACEKCVLTEGTVSMHENENLHLKQQIEELKKTKRQSEEIMSKFQAENFKLKEEICKSATVNRELKEQASGHRQEIEKADKLKIKLEAELHHRQSELDSLRIELDKSRDSLQHLMYRSEEPGTTSRRKQKPPRPKPTNFDRYQQKNKQFWERTLYQAY